VVIARSFARIHETNLKKQGILPLTFTDPADYDLIGPEDRISVIGMAELAPNVPVAVVVAAPDGTETQISCKHTYSTAQIEWFKAGSALNLIRARSVA
jgi:aconitate hydratase